MAKKPIRGRRTATTPITASAVTFGGSAAKQAVTFDDGEYSINVEGARSLVSKKGATCIVLTAKEADSDRHVLLRPLLVHSAGGDSQLIVNNRAILEMIAAVKEDEQISLDEMLKRLNAGVSVGAELRLTVDGSGKPINEIIDAWLDGEEA